MAHRGPDGTGHWMDGSVGLGHLVLRSTPESVFEKQPAFSIEMGLAITADARIDNRDDLCVKLGLPASETLTDVEIILRSYDKWADYCVEHLIGDFAFAIWDNRRRRLFCARDHFGVRPFCYHAGDSSFVFASEVKGVLAMTDVPRAINEGRIADFIVGELEGYDKVSTFYEHIFKLPPAHTLTVNSRGIQTRRYWRPEPGPEIHLASDEEYAEVFRDHLTRSVKCRLRTRSKAGILVSGGIDSATIWATARQISETGIHAFSGVSPPGVDCIETRLINELLEAQPGESTRIRWDQIEPYRPELERALRNIDDLYDISMTLQRVMYIAARRDGVNVVLDGIDADVVTSTTIHIAQLLRDGRWMNAWSEASGLSYFFKHFYSPYFLLMRGALSAFTPFWLRDLIRPATRIHRLRRAIKSSIINPEFARRVGLADRLDVLYGYGRATRGMTLPQKHALAMDHPYLTVGIERYSRAAAAHGIEPRHPYLDKRLAEFCLALPWHQKINHGWTKILMRRIMNGLIPESIRWRRGREHLGWNFIEMLAVLKKDSANGSTIGNLKYLRPFIAEESLNMISDVSRCSDETLRHKTVSSVETIGHFLNNSAC